MLYNRALILGRVETTFRTDAIAGDEVNAAQDSAFLVENPQYNPNVGQLTRANVKPYLSVDPSVPGRKQAQISFVHEVRGNGVNPPVNGTPPALGRLLQACSMARTFRTGAANQLSPVYNTKQGGSTGSFTLTGVGAYAGARRRTVRITCTSAGPPAVVTCTALAEGGMIADVNAGQNLQAAQPITLLSAGANGGSAVTANVATLPVALALGDVFEVDLLPVGHEYRFVSDEALMDSVTLYCYFDGLLHKLTGARGTWRVEGQGNGYAKFNFTFTGDYVQVTDVAIPAAPGYSTVKPRPVELAQFAFRDFADSSRSTPGLYTGMAPSRFALDAGCDVQIRENINDVEAYGGALIVGRAPKLTVDPLAITEATFPFWNVLKEGQTLGYHVLVGKDKGNVVRFEGPGAQIKNIRYGNRQNQRSYEVEADLTTASGAGNDEVVVAFN